MEASSSCTAETPALLFDSASGCLLNSKQTQPCMFGDASLQNQITAEDQKEAEVFKNSSLMHPRFFFFLNETRFLL